MKLKKPSARASKSRYEEHTSVVTECIDLDGRMMSKDVLNIMCLCGLRMAQSVQQLVTDSTVRGSNSGLGEFRTRSDWGPHSLR
jgi:hypothetical protein